MFENSEPVARISVRYLNREDSLNLVICVNNFSCMIGPGRKSKSKLSSSRCSRYLISKNMSDKTGWNLTAMPMRTLMLEATSRTRHLRTSFSSNEAMRDQTSTSGKSGVLRCINKACTIRRRSGHVPECSMYVDKAVYNLSDFSTLQTSGGCPTQCTSTTMCDHMAGVD